MYSLFVIEHSVFLCNYGIFCCICLMQLVCNLLLLQPILVWTLLKYIFWLNKAGLKKKEKKKLLSLELTA